MNVIEKESRVCPPDLLVLTTDNHMIPVEIKCIPSALGEHGIYYRALHLSSPQVKADAKILNEALADTRTHGAVIIVHVYHNASGIQIEGHGMLLSL